MNAKCCATCRHWNRIKVAGSWSGFGDCEAPLPISIRVTGLFSALSKVHLESTQDTSGADCPAYMKRIVRQPRKPPADNLRVVVPEFPETPYDAAVRLYGVDSPEAARELSKAAGRGI